MNAPEQIVCKPTPWFTLRAAAMLAMFSVFAVLFYIDGTTGYRKKNMEYYLHATFQKATSEFARLNNDGDLTPEAWQEYVQEQTVSLPDDSSVIPVDVETPMPWPTILEDFDKVKPLQHNILWQEYSGENQMNSKPPEKPFDAKKIREQIIVFYICLALALITLFFLIRTTRRSIRADDEGIVTVKGIRVPYAAMRTLDLRKWDTKGIAVIDYEGSSGKARARIDGLTYGGFKKEQDEPAERLMRKIRANFSGELIEYTTTTAQEEQESPESAAQSD